MMIMYTSIICAILTLIMASLHIALLLGAPIGEYTLGGKEKIIPLGRRWINALFSVLFIFLALLYVGVAGVIHLPFPILVVKIIMAFYTAFLAYASIFNFFITKSKKEKYVMTPASIIGFITSLITFMTI